MNRPLLAAALRSRNLDGAAGAEVVAGCPVDLDHRFGRDQLAGCGVENVKETALGNGHHDPPLGASQVNIGQHDVVVFGLQAGRACLEVPHICSRRRLDGDNAAGKKAVTAGLDFAAFTVVHAGSGRSKDHEIVDRVVCDRSPGIAATDRPILLAKPGLRGHLECLGLVWLRRIARYGPEPPDFFAGFRVVGSDRSPDPVVGSVISHEDQPLGHVGSARNAGLGWDTDGRLPDLLAGGRIGGDEAAIPGADIHLAIPDGNALVHAGGIGTVKRLVQANVRIKHPEQLAGRGFHCVDLGQRRADIGYAIHDNWLGHEAHVAIYVEIPGEAELVGVLVVDLLERAEVLGVKGAAVEQPVVGVDRCFQGAVVVNMCGLSRAADGHMWRQGDCDNANHSDGGQQYGSHGQGHPFRFRGERDRCRMAKSPGDSW